LSFDELLSLASTSGQRAEAHFYEGLMKLAEGDRSTALERLRSTLATNMLYYNEYHVAWDLERLLDPAQSTSR
jgi:16S rRNA C1402 (ribose-2'-O) methylase RsmI